MKAAFLVSIHALLMLTWSSDLLAQSSRWQVTLSTGLIFQCKSLERLAGDTLLVLVHQATRRIPVTVISEIRIVKDSKLLEMTGMGASIGFVIGAVYGVVSRADELEGLSGNRLVPLGIGALIVIKSLFTHGPVGGVIGGVLGGATGALYGIDKVFDLSEKPLRSKLRVINRILNMERG